MSERADPEAKNAVQALMNTAARVAEIQDRIRAGELHDIDFSGDLAEAAKQYVELKGTGQNVQDWLDQESLFDQNETVRSLVGMMEKYKRSGVKLTGAINDILSQVEAAGNPGQTSLIETAVPTKGEIIERASAEDGVRYSLRPQDPETMSVKDQLRAHQDELNKMDPVYQFSVDYQPTGNKAGDINWALSQLQDFGYEVSRKGFGTVIFDRKRVKNALNYLDTDAEKSVFAALPYVIRDGVEIGGHDNHKDRRYQTYTFGAPVVVNGQRKNVAVVVKKLPDYSIKSTEY